MDELKKLIIALMKHIEGLVKSISNLEKTHAQRLAEEWIDGEKVKEILKIGTRKLQAHRDNGTLPYSQIGGKIYFKTSDVEDLLNSHYNKR